MCYERPKKYIKSVETQVKELNIYGYTTIHLVGNWYLVRRYSKWYCKFSPYDIRHFKGERCEEWNG